MANTFLAAQDHKMGKSLVEEDKLELARALLKKAAENNVKMLLPVDLVMASAFAADATKVERVENLSQDYMALDIGPESRLQYEAALQGAKMIVWNGPMGVFEMDAFAHGTEAVAKAVAKSKAVSIVGGGDSVAAIEKTGLASKISHISTGGGASLEYLEGKVLPLPGIAALDDLRRKMVAGNWKMHKTVGEAVELAESIVEETNGTLNEVVIFPPFTALETVADAIDGKHVGYGAQDIFWEDEGAYTGAVSGKMIADICYAVWRQRSCRCQKTARCLQKRPETCALRWRKCRRTRGRQNLPQNKHAAAKRIKRHYRPGSRKHGCCL